MSTSSSHAKKIKLGFGVDLSGPYFREGNNELLGARLAVDQVNKKGGVLGRKVELVVKDSKLNPELARKNAIELLDKHKVDLLAGSISAATQITMNEEAKKRGIPFVSASQSNEITTAAHLGPYTFHEALTPYMAAQSVGRWVLNNISDSWFMLAADYAWGHQNNASYQKFAKENDVKVRGEAFFPLGSGKANLHFPKILRSKAEVLIVTCYGTDQVTFVNQVAKAELKKELTIVNTISEFTMGKQMDPSSAAGMYWGSHFYWGLEKQIPTAKKFVKAFRNAFNEIPTGYAGYAYSGVKELLWAVEEAGEYPIQPDKMTPCLEARTYDHYKGKQWWRPCDHQSFQDFYILKFKGPEERKSPDDVAEVLGSVSWDMGIERTCEELGHVSHLRGHARTTGTGTL